MKKPVSMKNGPLSGQKIESAESRSLGRRIPLAEIRIQLHQSTAHSFKTNSSRPGAMFKVVLKEEAVPDSAGWSASLIQEVLLAASHTE